MTHRTFKAETTFAWWLFPLAVTWFVGRWLLTGRYATMEDIRPFVVRAMRVRVVEVKPVLKA